MQDAGVERIGSATGREEQEKQLMREGVADRCKRYGSRILVKGPSVVRISKQGGMEAQCGTDVCACR